MYISRDREGSIRRSLHEQIAHDIGLQIASGHYAESDILPTEVALAERYRVSRTAVREAFRILSAKGMTYSRPKVGTRVRMRADWNMLDPDVLDWHLQTGSDVDFIRSVFELRSLVEPAAAALAATRRNDHQLRSLAASVGAMQRINASPEAIRAADVAFTQILLDASGNLLFRSLGKLSEILIAHTFEIAANVGDVRGSNSVRSYASRHSAVMIAIRMMDPDAARLEVAAMIDDAHQEMMRRLRAAAELADPAADLPIR